MRSCRADVAAYTVTTIACTILTIAILITIVLNHIYLVKDWLNKYDHMSFNRPQFMLMFDIYIVVRAITDSLPYDQMNIYVYYVKCLVIALYTCYLLVYSLFKVVFQSLYVQR